MSKMLIVLVCFLAVTQARYTNVERPFGNFRIKYGSNAQPGEFPFQVSFQIYAPPRFNYEHWCGGSIINERWILTAGHCIQSYEIIKSKFENATHFIKAGKHNLTATEDSEQVAFMESTFVHENFDYFKDNTKPFDIGLIKLKEPLKFNERIAPINLPKKNSEPTDHVTLSGWGQVVGYNLILETPDILQKANLDILDRIDCQNIFVKQFAELGRIFNTTQIGETNICTAPMDFGPAPCFGDSGGGLIKKDDAGNIEIVGIASWIMYHCGNTGSPNVFVRVSKFIDWIENIISKN